MMQVFVNKKEVELQDGSTVYDLVTQLGLLDGPIAVAIGTQIIARPLWEQTALSAGAAISVITICKGG